MEEQAATRKRLPKAVKILVVVVAAVAALGGFVLMAALKKPIAFPFLADARVVRTEEWIEAGTLGGSWGRLKTGGIYRVPGNIEAVAEIARHDLVAPLWKEIVKPTRVSFSRENQYVTLQDHPSDGQVIVFIQTYRSPSILDRIRLWYNHAFKTHP